MQKKVYTASQTSTPISRRCRTVSSKSTVLRANLLMDLVRMMSVSSGYLIQCNDEPRNPFTDCESGFKGFTFT